MNINPILFYLFSIIAIISAFYVVIAKNPINSVLMLILVFFNVSILWIFLGAEFLSMLLLITYVGAVMVFFLFVVMMLDQKSENLIEKKRSSYLLMGLTVAIVMILEIALILNKASINFEFNEKYRNNNSLDLGVLMYTKYGFIVQLGALLLLIGMVSAISLTARRRDDSKKIDLAKIFDASPEKNLQIFKFKKENNK